MQTHNWRPRPHPYLGISRRRFLGGGLALGAAALLPACGGDDDDDAEGTTTTGAAASTTAAAAASTTAAAAAETTAAAAGEPAKPQRLIVRSWGDPWSTTIGDIPGAAFTEATGIAVEFDLSDFGEVQTKVQQAVEAGTRPPVDIVHTIEPFAYLAGVQGIAREIDTAIVPNFDKLTSVGKAPDGSRFYANVYTYTLPIIYRPDLVTFEGEISWEEIFDPRHESAWFCTLDPVTLLYPISRLMGVDPLTDDLTPVWEKIATLQPNIGAIGDDTVFIETMTAGEIYMGSVLIGDAFALDGAGVEVEWIVPTEGVSLTADSFYIANGLPEEDAYWAQVFLNYVVDAELQTAWNAAVATVPTNESATPADFMTGDPAFPFTEEEIAESAIPVPVAAAAENADEWQEAYTAAIQG